MIWLEDVLLEPLPIWAKKVSLKVACPAVKFTCHGPMNRPGLFFSHV